MESLKMSSLGQFFADSLEKNMVMKDIEYQLVWWKTYWEWSENQKIDFKGFETIFLVCYQSSWWSLVGWASIETSLMTVTNVDPKATGYFKIQFKRSRKIFTPTTKSSQDEFWPFGIIERHFGLQQWAWLRSKMRHLMLRNKVPMAADQWWDWWDGFDERMKKNQNDTKDFSIIFLLKDFGASTNIYTSNNNDINIVWTKFVQSYFCGS